MPMLEREKGLELATLVALVAGLWLGSRCMMWGKRL